MKIRILRLFILAILEVGLEIESRTATIKMMINVSYAFGSFARG